MARTVSALSSRCSGSVPLWSEASPTSRIAFGLKYRANKKPVFGVAAAGLASAAVFSSPPSGDSSPAPRVNSVLSKREAYPRNFSADDGTPLAVSSFTETSSSSSEGTRTTLSGSSWRRRSTFIMADEKTREAPSRGSCAWISARPRSTMAKHRHMFKTSRSPCRQSNLLI